jgi:HNH endonuclease
MNECYVYRGRLNNFGYGRVPFGPQRMKANGRWSNGRRMVLLHRWVMAQMVGRELDRHEIVMHTCDNPSCFRFDHLRLGTQSDNLLDASAKGRLAHRRTK